jgi:hypothetical protein
LPNSDFYPTVRKISPRTGTCQWHVPGYEQNGETYTF